MSWLSSSPAKGWRKLSTKMLGLVISFKGQLLLAAIVTLVVTSILSFWPRWKKVGGLTKIAFWHRMQFMEHIRKTITICLVLGVVVWFTGWFVLGALLIVRTILLGMLGGILLSIPIGSCQKVWERKQESARNKERQKARAEEAESIKQGLGVYVSDLTMCSTFFFSSAGEHLSMKAKDFMRRKLARGEEPESWIIRHFDVMSSVDQLYAVSEYGWVFCGDGESRPCETAGPSDRLREIWITDRYHRAHRFVFENSKPSDAEVYYMLEFMATYESVKDYRQSYRAAQVADALRQRGKGKMPRSVPVAQAAHVLEMPLDELFSDEQSPNIAREIFESEEVKAA